MEPLTFELLRGSVIDLENVHMAREGRLPQRKAVEAGTDDHILVHATPNRHLQGVLGIPRTEDGPSITSVQLQGSVQERARILKALAPFPGGWAQSLEDDTQDGVSFCLRDEPVSPRIVDEWQRSQASVCGAHQGGAESGKTCPRLFHVSPPPDASATLPTPALVGPSRVV
jgi:hypothetical protein